MMLSILLSLAPCPLSLSLPYALALAQELSAAQVAQDAGAYKSTIRYFHPKKARTADLQQIMMQLADAGELRHTIADEDGDLFTQRPAFLNYGNALLVRDSIEGMPQTLALLSELDKNYANPSDPGAFFAPDLLSVQFSLTHVGVRATQSALLGLYNNAQGISRPQLSFVEEQGLVMVRGTQEQIVEVESILKKLDVPKQQVMLNFYLIQGCPPEDGDTRVPADLTRDLAQLVPYSAFKMLTSAILPSDTSGDIEINATLEGGQGDLRLEMRPQAYDASSGTLTVADAQVRLTLLGDGGRKDTNSFRTSTSLTAGNYTVLGAVGATPVFMVIKLSKLP